MAKKLQFALDVLNGNKWLGDMANKTSPAPKKSLLCACHPNIVAKARNVEEEVHSTIMTTFYYIF